MLQQVGSSLLVSQLGELADFGTTCIVMRPWPAAAAIYYGETGEFDTQPFTPNPNPLDDACNEAATNIHHSPYTALFALAWFFVTLSFQLCCPMEYEPVGWHVPYWLMPWLPSLAIGLVVFRQARALGA